MASLNWICESCKSEWRMFWEGERWMRWKEDRPGLNRRRVSEKGMNAAAATLTYGGVLHSPSCSSGAVIHNPLSIWRMLTEESWEQRLINQSSSGWSHNINNTVEWIDWCRCVCQTNQWLVCKCWFGVVGWFAGRGRIDSNWVLFWYKSMNMRKISEDRCNKASLLLTILCSLLSRLQRIYRTQYLDWNQYGVGPKPIVAHVIESSVMIIAI